MEPAAAMPVPPSDEYDELAYQRHARAQRRKLLYAFLVFTSLTGLVLLLELSLLSLRTDLRIENLERLGPATLAVVLASLVTHLWARRDPTAAAFFFLSVCVVIVTFIDDPVQVTSGRSMFSFPVIIMAAGLLLPAYGAFVFAGFSAAAVALLALFATHDVVRLGINIIIFLFVAAVIWYIATRLERANLELAHSRADFRLLFAENPLPMALVDHTTRTLVDVNRAAEEQYGYAHDEFLRNSLANVIAFGSWRDVVPDFVAAGPPFRQDQKHVTASGEIIDVALTVHRVRYDRRDVDLIVAEDITERVRAREQLHTLNAELEERVEQRTAELSRANAELAQSNRLKDEFLATMSHELRTPLTGVLALSEGLAEQIYGDLTGKQMRVVQAIRRSGERLLKLINNVLDFSQAEAGMLEIVPQLVAVNAICQAALNAAEELAAPKRQQVTAANTCVLGGMVWADPARLQQILYELLANAVKFTPAGGEVGLQAAPGAGPRSVQFDVWDTGIGIAPEELARLFDPFHQVDSGLNRSYEGAGLGLALVQRLVILQGGTISAESTPGQGSRFTVTLPCAPPTSDSAP